MGLFQIRQVNELFQEFTTKKKLKGADKDVSGPHAHS